MAVLLTVAGCARLGCEKSPAAEVGGPLRYLPRTAEAALVVPDLGVIGDRLALLEKLKIASFAAQLQGVSNAKVLVDALIRDVGVELRSREELKKAGLAPERGFGAAVLPQGEAFFVVGVSDAGRFGETIKKLAQTRLGAGVESTSEAGGRKIVSFSRAAGAKPEFGYVLLDGYALAAPGELSKRLPEFASLAKEKSLAADPQLEGSLSRLPKERDLIVHLPATELMGAPRPSSRPAVPVPVTLVASLGADALKVHADVPWPDSVNTLGMLERKDGAADLLKLLPSDAFVVARFGGDAEALEPVLPMILGPYLQRAFEESKLDLKKEVLANLQPGSVAALAVSPTIPLGMGMPQFDVRRTNPFKYVHLVALAQTKQPEKLEPLLARMPELAPRFGARIEPTSKDGDTLYVTSYAHGEGIHFADAAGKVVFASPLGRLERALATVKTPEGSTAPALLKDPALAQVLKDYPLAVVVDLHQLADSVKALPSEAWGIGGFAIKATTVRWLEGMGDLRAITLGMLRKDNAVQAELALRFAKQ
ncbi:MAG: hypothetical protein WBV82_03990 [Myxococcaceae bacterium]